MIESCFRSFLASFVAEVTSLANEIKGGLVKKQLKEWRRGQGDRFLQSREQKKSEDDEKAKEKGEKLTSMALGRPRILFIVSFFGSSPFCSF
jgi:hypothetical protein